MNGSRSTRASLWLSQRAWVWIAGLTLAVVLLGFGVLGLLSRVNDNATKLNELRYRSCIEDAVLDFKIAEGELIAPAFAGDREAIAAGLPAYREALTRLHGAQMSCRAQFPD